MKKIEQGIKKQRNDTDPQVKKYKQDLDVIGIGYDHKSAHCEVPNHATGGFEYFKWDWMTSTTGSHSEIVQIFKKIVRTLKETKNNPAQYENLVSNLDASTKNALDVNIKKYNITVPTQDTNKLIDEVLTGMQTWLDTKSHIPIELKQKFLELGPNNLEKFIESAFNKFNNKWTVKEFINNAFVPPREESNKYLADSGCDSAEQLWTKMENPRISEALNVNIKKHNITVPTQDTNKLIDEVLTGMQTWLDTKSHIPIELKQKFLELGPNNLEKFIESAFNKFNNKWTVKEFINNAFVPPREESNKYLADSGCDSAEQLWTKMENPRISEALNKATTSSVSSSDFKGNTSDEDSDDDIEVISKIPGSDEDSDDDIEVISKILGSEVTFTNGAKYEVKKIIDLLDKPNFIKQLTNILSKLSPEDSNLVKKEIALKLAYISNNDKDKYEAVHEIVDNMPQTFIDEFNNYYTLALDQMRIEEAKILGDGVSYL